MTTLGHRVLRRRKLSTHFSINRDGQMEQWVAQVAPPGRRVTLRHTFGPVVYVLEATTIPQLVSLAAQLGFDVYRPGQPWPRTAMKRRTTR